MGMTYRVCAQIEEALGCDNRHFCSEFYGYEVDEPNLLMEYFIRSGAAANFFARYKEAMGEPNRWFCGECYGHRVNDEKTLWEYFNNHEQIRAERQLCTT